MKFPPAHSLNRSKLALIRWRELGVVLRITITIKGNLSTNDKTQRGSQTQPLNSKHN